MASEADSPVVGNGRTHLDGRPTSPPTPTRPDRGSHAVAHRAKRGFDLLVSAAVLVVSAPIQATAALAILLDDGRPVLFVQQRAGLHGVPFRLAKFRTMSVNDAPPEDMGVVSSDHPLVTRTGRWLRRLKIDELPQLLSVLRGDMSIVGPRPALVTDLDEYDDFERTRLAVRPGLTGWAQVNGNVTLSWPDRRRLDVWYVDHWSFRLDVLVLWKTIMVLARGEHPNHEALAEATEHENSVRRGG